MTRPTPEQIKKYLDYFNRLSRTEANIRFSHPHLGGTFTKEERDSWPDKDIVTVQEWLESLI